MAAATDPIAFAAIVSAIDEDSKLFEEAKNKFAADTAEFNVARARRMKLFQRFDAMAVELRNKNGMVNVQQDMNQISQQMMGAGIQPLQGIGIGLSGSGGQNVAAAQNMVQRNEAAQNIRDHIERVIKAKGY